MKKRSLLIKSILSTLLLTSTLSAQMHCKDGKCYIDLKKLSPARSVEAKVHAFKTLKKTFSSDIETIIFDPSKYIMSEAEKKSFTSSEPSIYNDENTIVLAHSKYIMSEEEKEKYYEDERLNKALALEKEEVIEPIILVEDKIIEKSTLPNSKFYCEIPKHAEYHPDTDSYECV